MSEQAEHERPPRPDTSHLITENDEPVDNIPSEKNQRLLVTSLYASWTGAPPIEVEGEPTEPLERRPFLATANVGLFDRVENDPLVPDVLVSNDVKLDDLDWGPNGTRSYFIWEHGKPPDLVVEFVSNRKGKETSTKLRRYAKMRVAYYVVFDPGRHLGQTVLRAYRLGADRLHPVLAPDRGPVDIEPLGLRLGLWEGTFEAQNGLWLRFFDTDGHLLLTGDERAEEERKRAEEERKRAEEERKRAEEERKRADEERKRADALAEKLRSLGIDPSSI